MAISLSDEQARQAALFSEIVDKFTLARAAFEATATDPGSGFDLSAYLALMPTPSTELATINAIVAPATYDANTAAPSVVPPTLLTPAAISALALAGYDSAYLEEMEQEIRSITADVITHVLPASLYNDYFKQGELWRAREARDKITDIKSAHARRGFPSAPMTCAKDIGNSVSEWQKGEYDQKEKTAEERLGVINKIFFSSIDHGINIEEIRARVIMGYAKFYANHNSTLARYYDLLVDEKVAEAQLALDNARAQLTQDGENVKIITRDNHEEVALPTDMLSRAMSRLENEFNVDSELIKRRKEGMEMVASTYGAWMAAAAGSMQSTITGKHTTAP